jgi:hypothetical protein
MHLTARRSGDTYYLKLGLGEEYSSRPGLEFQFNWMPRLTGLDFRFGGESTDLGWSVRVWFASLYCSLHHLFPRSWRSRGYAWSKARAEYLKESGRNPHVWAYMLDPFDGRRTGVSIHDGSLWFVLWNSDGGWSNTDQKNWPWDGNGWSWTFHVVDRLLGPQKYSGELDPSEPEQVLVSMPEGHYVAFFKQYRCQWSRRWWKGPLYWRAEISVPSGIPFPGKGENSHDCGEDATYGVTLAVSRDWINPHQAALNLALEMIRRRGGCAWRPEPKQPTTNTPAPPEAVA